RPLTTADRRQRTFARATSAAARRRRGAERRTGPVPDPDRYRGGHPRGRQARPGRRDPGAARRRRRVGPLQVAHGEARDDAADDHRNRQPAHRCAWPLHWPLCGRPQSEFDADVVFRACERFATAVEINSRPERLDPPNELLKLAVEIGCRFAINTDAHAPGQLEWQSYGADKAFETGVTIDRVVNSWSADKLLEWTQRSSSRTK